MELPHGTIIAPRPITADLAEVSADADVISTSRKTAGLARLPEFRNLRRVWMSGADAHTVALVCSLPGLRELALNDYRGQDLSAVANAVHLESLVVWHASKLASLTGIERLYSLRELIIGELTRPLPLDAVTLLENLETLSIEGSMYRPLVVPSLQPLASLARLQRLRIGVKVADRSLAPLRGLRRVRDVFIANGFPVEEFARLAAAWPGVESVSLAPVRPTHLACQQCGGTTVLLTGGRGLKCVTCDAAAIQRHVVRFERELKSAHVVRRG